MRKIWRGQEWVRNEMTKTKNDDIRFVEDRRSLRKKGLNDFCILSDCLPRPRSWPTTIFQDDGRYIFENYNLIFFRVCQGRWHIMRWESFALILFSFFSSSWYFLGKICCYLPEPFFCDTSAINFEPTWVCVWHFMKTVLAPKKHLWKKHM